MSEHFINVTDSTSEELLDKYKRIVAMIEFIFD